MAVSDAGWTFPPKRTSAVRSTRASARSYEAAISDVASEEYSGAARAESDAILKRLTPGDPMLLLDEKGRELTSREFARELAALGLEKARCVTIVVGGAYGVDERVEARANGILSLSRMTLPHQLARIVLLEQIYRALTLQSGQPYHHD